MSEIGEIVARWEAAPWDDEQRTELAAIIADWRKRGEALEKARGIANTFWLDYPLANIADAGDICGICEGIADAIEKLKTAP